MLIFIDSFDSHHECVHCFSFKVAYATYHMVDYAQPCTYVPMYLVPTLCIHVYVCTFMYALIYVPHDKYALYMHNFICLCFVVRT